MRANDLIQILQELPADTKITIAVETNEVLNGKSSDIKQVIVLRNIDGMGNVTPKVTVALMI
jgi:hypothetical protein